MTFFTLGATNAKRNLARSLFALLSMAVAAGFLSYSISLSRGYPLLYKADCRAILGGEIIAYARSFSGAVPAGDEKWHYRRLDESPLSDLAVFHPELLSQGYLSRGEAASAFSAGAISRFGEQAGTATFQAIYPRYQLPATTVSMKSYRSTPLHGRDPLLDSLLTRHPRELLFEGRWFEAEDEDQAVAVISRYQPLQDDEWIPPVGSKLTVEIPRIRYVQGRPVFDETDPLRKEFTVIGHLAATTRSNDSDGFIYWDLNEIQIPLSTWQKLWQECGGLEYCPEQLSLITDQLYRIEDITASLRAQFPEYTLFSIAEQLAQAEQRGLIERLTPLTATALSPNHLQQTMPADLRLPLSLLIFANAALVVAANLLILANERKQEIAILKTLGTQRRQIVEMILTETLIISLFGASIGFVFFQIPAVLNYLANGLNGWQILQRVGSTAFSVFAFSTLFALVFGFLPGFGTAKLSVMEVLDSE